jgi:hypothetical protein
VQQQQQTISSFAVAGNYCEYTNSIGCKQSSRSSTYNVEMKALLRIVLGSAGAGDWVWELKLGFALLAALLVCYKAQYHCCK